MMMQTISPRGIATLVAHEGIVPGPYLDSVGVWTWGIGHTAAAGAPDPAKMPPGMPADLDVALLEVFDQFARDLPVYEADVRAAFTVPLAQHEFDAAVSFHYNTGAIARAEWVSQFNHGKRDAAITAILNWRSPAEIIPRRMAEQRLFRDGTYPDKSAPVWGVTEAGRVVWQVQRALSVEDVLAMLPHRAPKGPLGPGSKGERVRDLQTVLQSIGLYRARLDGDFGPLTAAAVQAARDAHNKIQFIIKGA
jgi:lysozyme